MYYVSPISSSFMCGTFWCYTWFASHSIGSPINYPSQKPSMNAHTGHSWHSHVSECVAWFDHTLLCSYYCSAGFSVWEWFVTIKIVLLLTDERRHENHNQLNDIPISMEFTLQQYIHSVKSHSHNITEEMQYSIYWSAFPMPDWPWTQKSLSDKTTLYCYCP